MKKVISASRRTDLVAFFPGWLASALRSGRALVLGPSGRAYSVDLDPAAVHTVVLWSKNFANLIEDRHGLKRLLARYDQIYIHFTITGLGGSSPERGAPPPELALRQLAPLVEIAGGPGRISLRFDPVVFWRARGKPVTNLPFFETLVSRAVPLGISTIRFSVAQWYGKSRRRAVRQGFEYLDPPEAEKIGAARHLAKIARSSGLRLFSCSQPFLAAAPGVEPSACIDGRLLQSLHPGLEEVSTAKDRTQRADCRCTASLDIGSYAQTCPHGCVYCYANPGV